MVILRMKRAGALAALLWAATLAPAGAVPPGFNIQGRLTDANGVNREGNYSIKFTLYDAPTSGAALWTRTYTALTVRNGNFQIILGDVAGQPVLSDVFAAGDSRHLEIQVLSGPGVAAPEVPLVPRQQLVSVPYALKAASADTLTNPSYPPAARQSLQVTVTPAAVTVTAEFLSVQGVGLTNVNLSKTVAPSGAGWHSINVVTNDAGTLRELCVVPGSLTPVGLTACAAGATRSRRLGWAHGRSTGGWRGALRLGDFWHYDEAFDELLGWRGDLTGTWATVSLAGLVPPSARMVLGNMTTMTTFPGADLMANIDVRPCSSPADHYVGIRAAGYNNLALTTDQTFLTDASQCVMLRGQYYGLVYVLGYYDPD